MRNINIKPKIQANTHPNPFSNSNEGNPKSTITDKKHTHEQHASKDMKNPSLLLEQGQQKKSINEKTNFGYTQEIQNTKQTQSPDPQLNKSSTNSHTLSLHTHLHITQLHWAASSDLKCLHKN